MERQELIRRAEICSKHNKSCNECGLRKLTFCCEYLMEELLEEVKKQEKYRWHESIMNEIGLQLSFFMAMNPPTITHQEKKAGVRKGKPYFYEPAELKAARQLLEAHLGQHVPCEPFQGALRLTTKWCFPASGKNKNGEYRITKPDTDNLQKLLKDCMTKVGFWEDDAQVASEIAEKFWADVPGIYISIEVLNT